jgi:hypothetical protein
MLTLAEIDYMICPSQILFVISLRGAYFKVDFNLSPPVQDKNLLIDFLSSLVNNKDTQINFNDISCVFHDNNLTLTYNGVNYTISLHANDLVYIKDIHQAFLEINI